MKTVDVLGGFVRLEDVQADDKMVVNAARVSFGKRITEMSTADEKLVGFLMRERHGSPFEHNSFTFHVKCPIFVAREWFRHRIGCLVGDTQITCVQPNGTPYKRSIEHIYRTMHGSEAPERWIKNGKQKNGNQARKLVLGAPRYRALNAGQNRVLRVLDETTSTFTTGVVADVWQTGTKPVYEVRTQDGFSVIASAEHPFLTTEGWVKVADMAGDEVLLRQGRVASTPAGAAVPPALRSGIGVWTTMQRTHLIGQGTNCYICGDLFSAENLVLDHKVPVVMDLTKALDINNLGPACIGCHQTKTNEEQAYARRGSTTGVRRDRLVGKPTYVGDRETYDIEMQGPHHNYLANDLVVHNSFNEFSARYTEMPNVAYVPELENVRTQVGKPGAYSFAPVSAEVAHTTRELIASSNAYAFEMYNHMLALGVAKEVARTVLPVGTYTEFYWTVNARSLMNFLSLRTSPHAQLEIREYANAVESYFQAHMPITYQAWVSNAKLTP